MNVKVIIPAGGDGTRLGALNKTGCPKSLIEFNNKPLISYQLNLISKAGINDVLLSVNSECQLEALKKCLKSEQISLNYTFGFHSEFGHPCELFRNKNIEKFIGNSPFIYTQSDVYYTKNYFKILLKAYTTYDCSMATKEPSRADDKKEIIIKNKMLQKIVTAKKVYWRYGGLYLITPSLHKSWYKMCNEEPIRTISFFEDIADAKEKFMFLDNKPSDIINMNTPKEFLMIKDLAGHRSKLVANRS